MNTERVPIETDSTWPDDVDAAAGVVTNWFVREGQTVDEAESVCEYQVEKVSVDVPAPTSGTLNEIVMHEDEEITASAVLGWIQPG